VSVESLDESSTSYEDDMGTPSELEEGAESLLDVLKSIPGTQILSDGEETDDEIDKGRCAFDHLVQPTA
jgi:hypothetical protein